MSKVYVVMADFGMNGSTILDVFRENITSEEYMNRYPEKLELMKQFTGFSGILIEEVGFK